MQTHLHGRDMITTQEWTKDELDTVIDVALDLKRRRALGEDHALLRDKVLEMLFFFSSTRTRASFEAGMAQLGGHAMFLDSTTTQIGHGDTWKEIGEILGRYGDGIAIRQVDWGIGNQYIRAVAEGGVAELFRPPAAVAADAAGKAQRRSPALVGVDPRPDGGHGAGRGAYADGGPAGRDLVPGAARPPGGF